MGKTVRVRLPPRLPLSARNLVARYSTFNRDNAGSSPVGHTIFYEDIMSYQPIEIRGKKILETIELDSRHDPADSILFKYYIKTQSDLVATAKKVAEEETTGRWIGGGEPTETYLQAKADVCRIEKYGVHEGVIYVQSPVSNLNFQDDLFYQIAMLSIGGPILEFVYYEQVAFIDFCLTQEVVSVFPGPKFGAKGTREFIGLDDDEPIIGTIVKPCCGLTPKEVAEKCYQAALGGCVLIKDDEKMMNPSYCNFLTKIRLVAEALIKAEARTGKKVIYAPHITARPDRIKETVKLALEFGATGVMFNAILASSLSTVELIASDSGIQAPIYVHSGGRSALSTGPRRIDDVVIAKLTRLCGGDYFQTGVKGQMNVHVASCDPDLLDELNRVFKENIPSTANAIPCTMNDTVPVTAGGLGVANAALNYQAYGPDVALLAGSNILDHPMGPEAGAIAMRQAVDAFREEGITDSKILRACALQKGYKEALAVL